MAVYPASPHTFIPPRLRDASLCRLNPHPTEQQVAQLVAQQVAGQVVADMNNVTSGALSAVGINSTEELGQYLGSWLGWLLNSLVPTAAAGGDTGGGAGVAAGAGGGQPEAYRQMQGQVGGQQQQYGPGAGGVVVVQHEGATVGAEQQQQQARVLQSQESQKQQQQQQQKQQQPGGMESDLVPFTEVGVSTAGDGSSQGPERNSTFAAAAGATNDTAPAFRRSNTDGLSTSTDHQSLTTVSTSSDGTHQQVISGQTTHGSASAQQPLPLPLQLLQELPPLAGRDINVNINVNVVPQTLGIPVPGTSGYSGVVGGAGGGPTCTCRCPLVSPGGVGIGGLGVGSALPLLRSSAPQGVTAGAQAAAGVGSGPAGGVPGQWGQVPAAGNGYASMQQSEGTETSPGGGGRLKDVLSLRPLKQWLEERQQHDAAAGVGASTEGVEGQQQQGEPAGGGRRLQQNAPPSGSYRPGTRRHHLPELSHASIPARWHTASRHADPGAGTALKGSPGAGAPNDVGKPLALQPDLRGIPPRRQLQEQNAGNGNAKGEQQGGKATTKQQQGDREQPPAASQSADPPKATHASPDTAAQTSAAEPRLNTSSAGGGVRPTAAVAVAGGVGGTGQGVEGRAAGAMPLTGADVAGAGIVQQQGGTGATVSVDQLLQAVLQQLAAGGLQMKLGVGAGGPGGGAGGGGAAVGPSATAVASAGVTDMKGTAGGDVPHGPNVNVNPIVVPGVLDPQRGVAGLGGSVCPPCIC